MLFMGKQNIEGDQFSSERQSITEDEKVKIQNQGLHFKKILSLISYKIHERFPNLLSAFRNMDVDHELSLSLNEFA